MRKLFLLSAVLFFANQFLFAQLTATITSYTNVSCNGVCDGTAQVGVTGGVSPYTYTWSSGHTTSTITNLCTGVYTVTVADVNSATAVTSVTISQPAVLTATVTMTVNPTCFSDCNGLAQLSASGGTPPYSYSWNNVPQCTATFCDQLCPGTYAITVTDMAGCTATTNFTISQPPPMTVSITSSTNSTCYELNNGSATAMGIGGVPPFAYQWSNGAIMPNITNLSPGVYCVTVYDGNGCTGTACTTITEPPGMNTIINITDATCGESNGSATINISNGTPPYNFIMLNDTSQVSSTISNLSAGAYFIEITDSIGCSIIDTILINNTGAPIIVVDSIKNVSCNSLNDGFLQISATGGIIPYTFHWNNDSISNSISNIVPGNYIVTVTDSVGCISVQSFAITQPGTLFFSITKTDANCLTKGTATVYPFGGTLPYTYQWDDLSLQTTATAINLDAGTYHVTVTDANLCNKTGFATVYLQCKNIISGKVFNDLNTNCQIDIDENGINNVHLIATPGNYYTCTNNQGNYYFMLDTGIYTISIVSPNYLLSCPQNPGNITVNLSQMGDTLSDNNFGVDFGNDTCNFDLDIHPGWTTAHPGFDKMYWFLYRYDGFLPKDVLVRFIYDPVLIYDSCTYGGIHYPDEHKIEWTFNNLLPGYYWDWATRPKAYFTVPVTSNNTDILNTYFEILPVSCDLVPTNNILSISEPITGSHDPNDKSVEPSGVGDDGMILPADSILTYRINFQNNGNDTAFTVILIDTLSAFVDPASVLTAASSHSYEFEMSEHGILKWTFNHIMLVDSNTNEPASHGFVIYTVKLKNGIPFGSSIENKADIYFDFNPAVTTNTARNTLVEILAIQTIKHPGNTDELEVFPNPFSDRATVKVNSKSGISYEALEIYNIVGMKIKTCKPANSRNEFTLLKENLKPGVYFIKANSGNSAFVTGKMIVE